MEVDELMKCMLDLFNNTDKALKEENERLKYKEAELQDVYHYLEGTHDLKGGQYAKIAKLIKTLREERREIKNNIDMLETIKQFTDKYNQKLISGDIIKNLKCQKDLLEKQEHPKYEYRTNIVQTRLLKG